MVAWDTSEALHAVVDADVAHGHSSDYSFHGHVGSRGCGGTHHDSSPSYGCHNRDADHPRHGAVVWAQHSWNLLEKVQGRPACLDGSGQYQSRQAAAVPAQLHH